MDIFKTTAQRRKEALVQPWKVLLVDDEEDVHHITRLALRKFTFEGRPVKLISAYSGEEARKILEQETDIALAIIDVVMEDDQAGLRLVKYIRETLGNRFIRLVIRTGQPGYAPRREVVQKYDINDYREKGEISSDVLYTIVVSGLRSYRDIMRVEREANLLRNIAAFLSDASSELSIQSFLRRVYHKVLELLDTFQSPASALFVIEGQVVEQTGVMDREVLELKDVMDIPGSQSFFWPSSDVILLHIKDEEMRDVGFIVKMYKHDDLLKNILGIFLHNAIVAAHNMELTKQLNTTLFDIIYLLTDLLGKRSGETGEHVARVAEIVSSISEFLGIDSETVYKYKLASMLHDVGKIGIPDNILNKPGSLTDEEFEIMKRHTLIGYEILTRFDKDVFEIAALIARYHHENFDGTGYPDGLKGEEIPLPARITAVADVYDALINDRVYRKAWPEDEVLAFIRENKGKKFDPMVVDIFIEHYDEIKKRMGRVVRI